MKRRMSVLIIFPLIIAGIAVGTLFGWGWRFVSPFPLEAVGANPYPFGHVYKGQPLSHVFLLKNISRRPLTIAKVERSCCLQASIERKRLESGDTTALQVRADTSKLEGSAELHVAVFLQNQPQPLVLRLRGNVVKQFPEEIDVGKVLRGQEKNVHFDIQQIRQRPIKVKDVDYHQRFLKVTVRPQGFGLRVQAQLAPNLPYGAFAEKITLITDDAYLPTKVITLRGEVPYRIVAEPDPISLGAFTNPRQGRAVVRLFSPYGDRFWVRAVKSDVRGLHLSFDRSKRDAQHQFTVMATSQIVQGSIKGGVVVRTSDPEVVLRLPVYGLYSPSKPASLPSLSAEREAKQ